MIRPCALARVAAGLCAALFAAEADAQRPVAIATADSSRMRYMSDPQFVCFAPVDFGEQHLTASPAPMPFLEEINADGLLFLLAAPNFEFKATDPDAESTSPPRYWARLESFFGGAAFLGSVADCRVTDALLDELESGGADAAEQFCQRFAQAAKAQIPLISFATSGDEREHQFRAILRRHLPQALIGKVYQDAAALFPGEWDFAVVRPELAPDQHRSQSMISYFRSALGAQPVFIEIAEPAFYPELFWMGTGAAGIYYRHDSFSENYSESEQWRAMRSFAAFRSRMPAEQWQFFSAERGVEALFGNPEKALCAIVRSEGPVQIALPATVEKPEMLGIWYDPVFDQNTVLPRTTLPVGRELRLESPSPEVRWIYCAIPLPHSTDADTTTPQVHRDPDLIFEE